ncbi:MAG: Unknown protein [uncultured Sulfurovum sp.]|uniref:Tetratricopeptide repeat-like domain-containing protein n=1 Tax=uncultured Sulfurovum sp. TaxID=269237 RepID=A0A6S6SSL9_9BACT|nr:MAG: Unknown protein [uncultured Sulfurovum sp.]
MPNYTRRFTLTIDDVKKELSGDEQMLASAFKAEKLYKKHKLKIFIVIGIVITYFAGTAIIETMAEDKRERANSAYLVLEKDAKDNNALNSLKSNNPALFELFSYQEAVKSSDTDALKSLSSSKNEIISDLSSYHLSIINNQPSDSKFNAEIGKIHNAALLIKEGKTTEAKEELELIPEESPVYNISKLIKHYSIKG